MSEDVPSQCYHRMSAIPPLPCHQLGHSQVELCLEMTILQNQTVAYISTQIACRPSSVLLEERTKQYLFIKSVYD